MSNYKELYDKWLNSPALTEEEKLQLKSVENDEVEKEDRFYKELEFGTAGLRGKVGMVSNRMNRFIIARATKAWAQTIIDNGLQEKGIVVIPDILANSGGVTVSYFEWVQNLQGYYWTEEEVVEKQDRVMTKAFNDIWEVKERFTIPMRKAAYVNSIEKIVKNMELKGKIS